VTVDVEVGMAKEAVVKGFAIKDCVCHGSTATVAVAVAAGAEAGGRGTEAILGHPQAPIPTRSNLYANAMSSTLLFFP